MKLSDVFKPLDETKFNMFHVKSLITTGMGVFTDGYDLSSIGIVLTAALASFGLNSKSPDYGFWTSWLASSVFIGSALAAIVFGFLVNKGRKTFYGIDVAILTIGAALQAFVSSPLQLVLVRFLLGIGIGADYVLSPTIMAENANAKDRGKKLALGFGLFWGFGATTAASVYLLLQSLGLPSSEIWRIVLGAGAIPAASVIYLRRKIPETPRYLLRIKGDAKKFEEVVRQISGKMTNANNNLKDTNSLVTYFKNQWKIFLIATLLWYLFDVVAYAGTLFGPTQIAKSIGINNPPLFQIIIEFGFVIPGGLVALATLDKIGRKKMQTIGFIGMALALLGFSIIKMLPEGATIPAVLTLIVYGMNNFWSQAGPGSVSAVGMLGVELAPTKARGIVQGITVAGGRLGAFTIGQLAPLFLFSPRLGVPALGIFLAVVAIASAVITYLLVPETKGKPLEEASMEIQYVKS